LRPLHFQQLIVRDLRVIRDATVDLAPGVNVISGANGQGKTTLLEAMYLVATSRSFRTHKLKEAVGHDADAFSVRATIEEGGLRRTQFIAVSGSERVLKIDDAQPESGAAYAMRTPAVVFHPGEVALSSGPASMRRTLLDRIALFQDPRSHGHASAYQRALKTRNRLLQVEGPTAAGMDAYEQLMARHGAALTSARSQAAAELVEACGRALASLGPEAFGFEAVYVPGGSPDPVEALENLRARRTRDARRASPGFGPHLDDLVLTLRGELARVVASQGQHRLLTLGLKIGETVCVARAAGVEPVLLLDDVSSELDAERTDALFGFLAGSRNQVLVTTTRPEWVARLRIGVVGTVLFEVVSGQVRQVTGN
jgi:DNA replication and repair protein RecF